VHQEKTWQALVFLPHAPQSERDVNISETGQIVIGVCLLIGVYILTRRFHAWRMARVYTLIVKDLEEKGAVDPSSAVELPYAQRNMFRIGTRDYRPKVLEYMTLNNVVAVTADGRYYLTHRKRDT
jgi:hypothetical protein